MEATQTESPKVEQVDFVTRNGRVDGLIGAACMRIDSMLTGHAMRSDIAQSLKHVRNLLRDAMHENDEAFTLYLESRFRR